MVHADYSRFSSESKAELYDTMGSNVEALVDGQTNWVANLANASSIIWHGLKSLPAPSNDINWAGFYVVDPKKPQQLILGPFHGQVACQEIPLGKGVCGVAAKEQKTQLVKNVEEFPGHIACDGVTKSEIVVPIVLDGKLFGVIDIDCASLEGFDEVDQQGLEKIALVLAKSCEW
ncbi:Free methionine-R-sulfoxide reductase [Yarrowia sp. B02]|nr:Free methionine-R-sulfoxide reductase [Yarrowia sp. B02]